MPGSEVGADIWVNEYITPWDIYSHGLTRVIANLRTGFQDMSIVESGVYGKALVLDGKWQSCTGDEYLYHEPLVHPGCVLHGSPENILILGGGEGATAREALRWKTAKRVVTVDIDGDVVEACREHLPEMHQGAFENPRHELVVGDALAYLDDAQGAWDVIISDLSDPIEEGPSFALFTKEYFAKCKRALAPGGVLVIQAGSVGLSEVKLHVKLINTLKAVFPHVHHYSSHIPTYGSPWGFGVARDEPISSDVDPQAVDELLAAKTTGGFRMFDGRTLLGLFNPPLHLRRQVEAETEVYTQAAPPRFFGKGVAQSAEA